MPTSLTILDVVGVRGQAQGGAAVLALEAAAVEELALGAEPLHHVDALAAEVAHVTASQVLGELLLQGALGTKRMAQFDHAPKGRFISSFGWIRERLDAAAGSRTQLAVLTRTPKTDLVVQEKGP